MNLHASAWRWICSRIEFFDCSEAFGTKAAHTKQEVQQLHCVREHTFP